MSAVGLVLMGRVFFHSPEMNAFSLAIWCFLCAQLSLSLPGNAQMWFNRLAISPQPRTRAELDTRQPRRIRRLLMDIPQPTWSRWRIGPSRALSDLGSRLQRWSFRGLDRRDAQPQAAVDLVKVPSFFPDWNQGHRLVGISNGGFLHEYRYLHRQEAVYEEAQRIVVPHHQQTGRVPLLRSPMLDSHHYEAKITFSPDLKHRDNNEKMFGFMLTNGVGESHQLEIRELNRDGSPFWERQPLFSREWMIDDDPLLDSLHLQHDGFQYLYVVLPTAQGTWGIVRVSAFRNSETSSLPPPEHVVEIPLNCRSGEKFTFLFDFVHGRLLVWMPRWDHRYLMAFDVSNGIPLPSLAIPLIRSEWKVDDVILHQPSSRILSLQSYSDPMDTSGAMQQQIMAFHLDSGESTVLYRLSRDFMTHQRSPLLLSNDGEQLYVFVYPILPSKVITERLRALVLNAETGALVMELDLGSHDLLYIFDATSASN